MNAIERLRGSMRGRKAEEEALAAVEALYQAASDVLHTKVIEVPEGAQERWGVLAAAVRRVEGDPVDDAAIEQQVRYRDAWDTGERITIEELERRVEGE